MSAIHHSLHRSAAPMRAIRLLPTNTYGTHIHTRYISSAHSLYAPSHSSSSFSFPNDQRFPSRWRRSHPPPSSYPASSATGGADQPNGVFAVFKPKGLTSAATITEIKHMFARREGGGGHGGGGGSEKHIRIGHGGTLDKNACGILVVGIGSGTKELQRFLTSEKVYRARAKLGFETDSHDMDPTAKIVSKDRPFGHVTLSDLESYLSSSYGAEGGRISQKPPLYSALKQNGQRISNLVREGHADQVDLNAKIRYVDVFSIRVIEFEPPYYTLDITCGSGFYVRSLIRDIGQHFDCGSTMLDLMRVEQSGFDVNDSHVIRLDETLAIHHVKEKEIAIMKRMKRSMQTQSRWATPNTSNVQTTTAGTANAAPSPTATGAPAPAPAPSLPDLPLVGVVPSPTYDGWLATMQHLPCNTQTIQQVLQTPIETRRRTVQRRTAEQQQQQQQQRSTPNPLNNNNNNTH